jgi:hypothetical protein
MLLSQVVPSSPIAAVMHASIYCTADGKVEIFNNKTLRRKYYQFSMKTVEEKY